MTIYSRPFFRIHPEGYVTHRAIATKLVFNGEKSIWDILKDNYPNYNDYRFWKYDDKHNLIPCNEEESQVLNQGYYN